MGSGYQPPSRSATPIQYDKPLPPLRAPSPESWDIRRRPESRSRYPTPSASYDGKPLPPMRDATNDPTFGPRKPNMSLFSLFSKPKVQKLRGYAESGLATPTPQHDAYASRTDLADGLRSSRTEPPSRAGSSMSIRTHRTQKSGNATRHPTARRISQDQRIVGWNPPPLFQAFARSTKHGLVEVTTASPEALIAKSRAKKIGALQIAPDAAPRGSTDTGRSGEVLRLGRFTSRNSNSVHVSHVDVERKIFVLVTSGHLLQYSEYGPSGRLPEKVLLLCEASAAFASDLISGRPHVAQVSQAVDEQGLPVAPTNSLLSRLGSRSSTAKKLISDVLLILPDGDELKSWLSAIRQQIEELGGPPGSAFAEAEVPVEPPLRLSTEPEPSYLGSPQMQRYHIKRRSEVTGSSSMPVPDANVSPIDPPQIAEPLAQVTKPSRNSQEEAEAFADMLAAGASYTKPGSTRGRSPSDALSVNSSVAQSVDHLRLNSLRSSVRMSVNTNVTGWTSRTNSLTSEHAPNKRSFDGPSEQGSRGPYRNLSSYSSGKRRSAMPAAPPVLVPTSASIEASRSKISSPNINESEEDSPVMGYHNTPLTALPPIVTRVKPLNTRQSMPQLSESQSKNDSPLEMPPPIAEDGERPQSFVGDLPSPSHWTTKLSPAKRSSSVQPLPTDKQLQRMSSAPALRGPAITSRPTRRNSSQPFNLPLKINPSSSPGSASWRSSRQTKTISPADDTMPPRVHTLEAQIASQQSDPTTAPSTIQEDNIPHNPPGPAEQQPIRKHSTTKRLSIFPPTQPTTPSGLGDHIPGRPPSVSIIPQHPDTTRSQLKRPISIQIRTSPAPFLSTRQNFPTPPQSTGGTRSFTPPIRSLKPSRDPIPGNSFAQAQSFTSPKKSRASLPALDLGMPVVGLGPPAPPPSAPLPRPPTLGASRSASPLPDRSRGDGLGIRVGS